MIHLSSYQNISFLDLFFNYDSYKALQFIYHSFFPVLLKFSIKAVQREREEKLAVKLRDFLNQYVRGDKDGFIRQAESEAERLSRAG